MLIQSRFRLTWNEEFETNSKFLLLGWLSETSKLFQWSHSRREGLGLYTTKVLFCSEIILQSGWRQLTTYRATIFCFSSTYPRISLICWMGCPSFILYSGAGSPIFFICRRCSWVRLCLCWDLKENLFETPQWYSFSKADPSYTTIVESVVTGNSAVVFRMTTKYLW